MAASRHDSAPHCPAGGLAVARLTTGRSRSSAPPGVAILRHLSSIVSAEHGYLIKREAICPWKQAITSTSHPGNGLGSENTSNIAEIGWTATYGRLGVSSGSTRRSGCVAEAPGSCEADRCHHRLPDRFFRKCHDDRHMR